MSDDMKCSGVRDCCSPHIHRNIHYEDQFIYKNQTRRVQSVEIWNFGENGPGVPVDRLNMWCAFSVKVPVYILGCSSKGIESRLREVIIPLYLAIVKLHLEYCVQLWAPQYKKYIGVSPEKDHQDAGKGWELGLFSLKRRRPSEGVTAVLNYLMIWY